MIDAVHVRPLVCIREQSILPVPIHQKVRDALRHLLLTAKRFHNIIENIFIYRVVIYDDALRNCIRNRIASGVSMQIHTDAHAGIYTCLMLECGKWYANKWVQLDGLLAGILPINKLQVQYFSNNMKALPV